MTGDDECVPMTKHSPSPVIRSTPFRGMADRNAARYASDFERFVAGLLFRGKGSTCASP